MSILSFQYVPSQILQNSLLEETMNGTQLHILYDNIFMQKLKEHHERKYFLATLAFCMLAENKWAHEKTEITVKHGYSHISKVINNIVELFNSHDGFIDNLDIKSTFLFLSSVYLHDIGFVAFYDKMFTELSDDSNLSFFDKIKIRKEHATIIDKALTDLSTTDKVRHFLGNDIISKIQKITGDDPIALNETIELINENRRKIALICRFHNSHLRSLPALIESLRASNQLIISDSEKDRLVFLTACLQFADALDMTSERIDIPHFKYLINELKKEINPERGIGLGFEDIQLMEKMFLCYLIDKIEIVKSNNVLNYRFKMSLRENDISGHDDQIQHCKNAYLRRLRRAENDCITILESELDIRINFNFDEEPVTVNDSKILIEEPFFRWVNKESYKTIDILLQSHLKSVSKNAEFAYVKLYSAATKVFFDGLSHGIQDRSLENRIKGYCFLEKDWNIPRIPGFFILKKSDFGEFLVNKVAASSYKDYFKYLEEKEIEYEVYYGLGDGKRNFIGFVNLHYKGDISDSKVKELKAELDDKLGTLGIEIARFHEKVGLKDVKSDLANFELIDKGSREDLITLYENRYNPDYDFGKYCKCIPVRNIREILNIEGEDDHDFGLYVIMNDRIFKEIINISLEGDIPENYLDFDFELVSKRKQRSLNITITMKVNSDSLKGFLIESYPFLNSLDNSGTADNLVLKRYFIPFKIFINIFGGAIEAELLGNNTKLKIDITLPQLPAEELEANGFTI